MTTKKPKINNTENKVDLILPKRMESQLPKVKDYSHSELIEMSNIYYKSQLIPSHLKTPEAVYIAMRWALALGVDPFLGLRDIFIIENIPSVRTEAAIALVESSGFNEYIIQEFEGKPYEDNYTAICRLKPIGKKEHISTFSVEDAKRAGLWGKKTQNNKPTSWISYPKRMLMYRAVGFAIRDIYPHVLRGATLMEETIHYSQFEIVEDNSNANGINVKVIPANSNKGSGLNRMNKIMDEPPED